MSWNLRVGERGERNQITGGGVRGISVETVRLPPEKEICHRIKSKRDGRRRPCSDYWALAFDQAKTTPKLPWGLKGGLRSFQLSAVLSHYATW